ncbi:MAG: twin-arginine translocase TatA/TatE family subunit [Chloroflexota bacterium]|nr:MAG: twin-arginine translocase TatA/TatE family subunit [Chloroflexota bacterium]
MDILGIGPLELIFILIIALIVLGPSDMVKAGRTIGKFLRQVVTSSTWRAVTRTSNELRTLPNKLIRDAGLEEDLNQIQQATKQAIPPNLNSDLSKWQEDIDTWTTPPSIGKLSPEPDETTEQEPSSQDSPTDEEQG